MSQEISRGRSLDTFQASINTFTLSRERVIGALKLLRYLEILRELLLLSELEKVTVDVESILMEDIPHKAEILKYIRKVFNRWVNVPEVKELKIEAGIPEGGLNSHIFIIAKFRDSEKAVDLSEELEYQLLSADPKISNRIVVYSLFG
ncbi:hypothetical protein QDY65_01410 [Pyrococcus kukulkanii]|uniref:hypothetical protein n=1 Tax=Pyrococcus kukulkanii TaxID=1609559 RepID=UPI003566C0A7